MTKYCPNGEVEFRFFRPAAQSVHLAGDFNSWQTSATPMQLEDGGWWRCTLRLPPGVYQFKYLADGCWYVDYGAFGLERGPLGGWNSTLWVSPQHLQEKHEETEAVLVMDDGDRDDEASLSFAMSCGSAA